MATRVGFQRAGSLVGCVLAAARGNAMVTTRTSADVLLHALQTARKIAAFKTRVDLLSQIALAYAKCGYPSEATRTFDAALQTARQIQNGRTETIGIVARYQLEAGLVSEAQQTADQTGEPHRKEEILAGVVKHHLAAERLEKAMILAENLTNPKLKVEALGDIANALAKDVRLADAEATLRRASELVNAITDETHRESARWRLTQARAKNEALEIARTSKDNLAYLGRMTALAQTQAQAGRVHEARALFAEVSQRAHSLNPDSCATWLRWIARRQELGGLFQDSIETLNAAAAVLAPRNSDESNAMAAAALMEQGKTAEACAAARQIVNPSKRAYELAKIASRMAKSREVEQASGILAEVLDLSGTDSLRDYELSEWIIVCQCQLGAVVNALASAEAIDDVQPRIWALIRIAEHLAWLEAGSIPEQSSPPTAH